MSLLTTPITSTPVPTPIPTTSCSNYGVGYTSGLVPPDGPVPELRFSDRPDTGTKGPKSGPFADRPHQMPLEINLPVQIR